MTAVQKDACEVLVAATIGGTFLIAMIVILCAIGFDNACEAYACDPLIPDPCVLEGRGHRVIASGVFVGCTADPTNFRG